MRCACLLVWPAPRARELARGVHAQRAELDAAQRQLAEGRAAAAALAAEKDALAARSEAWAAERDALQADKVWRPASCSLCSACARVRADALRSRLDSLRGAREAD